MQVKVITLAIPALAMFAFAQTEDPSQQTTTGQQEVRTETQAGTTATGQPPRHARTDPKAQTYKGTLVDASCATAKAGVPHAAVTTAERAATEEPHAAATMGAAGMPAHVDAKAISQSCPVTSTTKDFALVTSDGRLMQFNAEGDAKAASEVKTNDKWTKAINSNKRITASVKGVLQGDTLQVESVK
jgi:hypothetical protein